MGLLVFGGIIIILGRLSISWFLRGWLRWLEFEWIVGFQGLKCEDGGEKWEQRGKAFGIRMSIYSKEQCMRIAMKARLNTIHYRSQISNSIQAAVVSTGRGPVSAGFWGPSMPCTSSLPTHSNVSYGCLTIH
jgi:hypothetical protein